MAKNIDLKKISANNLYKLVKKYMDSVIADNKIPTKTHINNYLKLGANWKRDLKNTGLKVDLKKIDIIEGSYRECKELMIDELMKTKEGQRLVYQTHYFNDERVEEQKGNDHIEIRINTNEGRPIKQ